MRARERAKHREGMLFDNLARQELVADAKAFQQFGNAIAVSVDADILFPKLDLLHGGLTVGEPLRIVILVPRNPPPVGQENIVPHRKLIDRIDIEPHLDKIGAGLAADMGEIVGAVLMARTTGKTEFLARYGVIVEIAALARLANHDAERPVAVVGDLGVVGSKRKILFALRQINLLRNGLFRDHHRLDHADLLDQPRLEPVVQDAIAVLVLHEDLLDRLGRLFQRALVVRPLGLKLDDAIPRHKQPQDADRHVIDRLCNIGQHNLRQPINLVAEGLAVVIFDGLFLLVGDDRLIIVAGAFTLCLQGVDKLILGKGFWLHATPFISLDRSSAFGAWTSFGLPIAKVRKASAGSLAQS